MQLANTRKYPLGIQFLISIVFVLSVSFCCVLFTEFISYREVALILLLAVSVIAMLFEILPVLIASILSAVIWNFLFIPPIFTFHIDKTEDVLMFSMYFIIAMVNAVLSFKIRKEEKKTRDEDEKEKTIRLYNTLLNSLSHELRTPISTIIGAVDILQDHNSKLSKENSDHLMIEIEKAGLRLNRQVENLLSMSRLESGMLKPKYDWCDVNECINSTIQKIDCDKNHKIVLNIPDNLPLFKIDEGLLEQIIHNLVHNAIQYTPKESTIYITAAHEDDNCVITISDNGKGFPAEKIQLAFDKFYRIPETNVSGSGLGLSIVKGFAEAMNGQVSLQNNSSGGATFIVSIPTETSYISNLKNE